MAKAIGVMEGDEADGVRRRTTWRRSSKGFSTPLARRRRVSVGKLDERVGILAKRLLPYRVFERAAKGGLGL